MSWIPRQNARPFIVLAVFVLVWAVLPDRLLNMGKNSFYSLQAPAWVTLSHLDDLSQFWTLRTHSKQDLIEAGRDMARMHAAYSLRVQENSSLRQEVNRLESLLGLPAEPDFRLEVARVVRRDIASWWQQIIIRKGAADGIEKGQAVVYAGGVVGRVQQVYRNTSVVILLSNPAFRMAANFEDDSRPVTYQGRLNPPLSDPQGEVRDVVPGLDLEDGEPRRLVSSRLGGAFPQGLTIGVVTSLEPGADGLFQQGVVQLPAALLQLQEVAVLIPLEPRQHRLAADEEF